MAEQANIGFVGIGAMGWHMAANLVRREFPVAVYDLDRARQERFAQSHQCRAASSLADLGRDVSTVITMLPTGRDVRHVLLTAEDGALGKALKPGAIVDRHEFVRPGGHARACRHARGARRDCWSMRRCRAARAARRPQASPS